MLASSTTAAEAPPKSVGMAAGGAKCRRSDSGAGTNNYPDEAAADEFHRRDPQQAAGSGRELSDDNKPVRIKVEWSEKGAQASTSLVAGASESGRQEPKPLAGSTTRQKSSSAKPSAARSLVSPQSSLAPNASYHQAITIKVDGQEDDNESKIGLELRQELGCARGGQRELAGYKISETKGNEATAIASKRRLAAAAADEKTLKLTNSASSQELALADSYSNSNSNDVLADVRANFTKLIRHNKLQYFYLGALIFSVMNICFIVHSSVKNHHVRAGGNFDQKGVSLDGQSGVSPELKDRQESNERKDTFEEFHNPASGSKENEQRTLGQEPQFYSSSSNSLQHHVNRRRLAAVEPLESQFGLLLSTGLLLPLTLLLTLIATITTLQFGYRHQQRSPGAVAGNMAAKFHVPAPTADKQRQQAANKWSRLCNLAVHLNLLQLAGLLLTLALLHLPLIYPLLTYAADNHHRAGYLFTSDSNTTSPAPDRATISAVKTTAGRHYNSKELREQAINGQPIADVRLDKEAAAAAATEEEDDAEAASLRLHQPFREQFSSWSQTKTRTRTETATAASGKQQTESHSGPIIQIAAKSQPIRPARGAFAALLGVGSILALLYLEPILMEGGPISARLVCALTLAVGILLMVANQSPSRMKNNNQNSNSGAGLLSGALVFLCLSTLALIAGYLKRRQFVTTVTKLTFARAEQLIEAKVSLEHQRQQQETLLLSVLPAYVAEQVKRNMVKKMNSTSPTNATTSHASSSALNQHQPMIDNMTAVAANNGGNGNLMTSASAHHNHNNQQRQQQSMQQSTHSWLRAATMPSSATISNSFGQNDGTRSTNHQLRKQNESTAHQPAEQHHLSVDGVQQRAPFRPRSSLSKLGSGVATIGETLGSIGSIRIQLQHSINSPAQSSSNGNNQVIISPQVQAHSSSAGSSWPYQPAAGVAAAAYSPALQLTHSSPSASSSSAARRGFNELYIRTYNNVSLLYGDIVGFTRLCTKLSSSQLVRVLNDLFSHFDYLAERHKIMRIKILGDCYYGVSGIPEFAVMGAKSRASRNDNHAINCVNMGLDMIQYIKCLNVERATRAGSSQDGLVGNAHGAPLAPGMKAPLNSAASVSHLDSQQHGNNQQSDNGTDTNLGAGQMRARNCKSFSDNVAQVAGLQMPQFELNMRIGVHSGHIHSGVIGLKKWQFDVWSNDVSIAMHCESSGVAGRVQVTEATIQQLNGAFSYESVANCGAACDSFLSTRDIKTYLIRDRVGPAGASSLTINQLPTMTLACGGNRVSIKLSPLDGRQSIINSQVNVGGASNNNSNNNSSSSTSKLDNEQKIRTATIETIRETLLAGEACNSSAPNSYGLALDHPDINAVSLSYRDGILNKLYDARPVGGCFQESLTMLLLFALILPAIDYLFFLDKLPILIFSCVIALMTLISCSSCRMSRRTKSPRSSIIDYSYRGPLDEEQHSQLETAHEFSPGHRCQANSSLPMQQQQQEPKSNRINVLRKTLFDFKAKVRKKVEPLVRLLELELPRSRLKVFAASMTIISVILFQGYLIASLICQSTEPHISDTDRSMSSGFDCETEERQMIASELYQLTVILLLIAIDLCNHTLSFGAKYSLILMIIILHIVAWVSTKLLVLSTQSVCSLLDQGQHQVGQRISFVTNRDVLEWSSWSLTIVFALWSLAFARQLEYTSRANFLWRNRLNVDHEEVEYISGINKVLLENILPSHVVQHYLTNPCGQPKNARLIHVPRMSFSNMRSLSDELYHEQHDSVAVMFASIPHFYEFYDESDISKQGLGCIALLNEIICDFDKLLLKNKFSRIEKIKTIGSTYMAAAGLRPCHPGGTTARSSNVSQTSQVGSRKSPLSPTPTNTAQSGTSTIDGPNDNSDDLRAAIGQRKLNLVCMIQFATSLMTALNGINKQSFQVFKLRVGVNAGPVIAGIIGAQRPFYDIWGDCVNIASRMESLGEVGRIQVEERTAKLLMESLCNEKDPLMSKARAE